MNPASAAPQPLARKPVQEASVQHRSEDFADLLTSEEPVVLRGFVDDWPLVAAGRTSLRDAVSYMKRYYDNATVGVWLADPDIEGRFFYNDDLSGFNYRPAMIKLGVVLDKLVEHAEDPRPPGIYVGSTTVDTSLPGLRTENDVDFGPIDPLASIWIGNRGRIAAHYDLPDNLACNVVGRRRFTLFPPEQLENLYVGPLDFTPAGQAVSLVDFMNPDFERFPRFRTALDHALAADLEPGDALFVPSMWWHHVEAFDALNVLINYWWRQSPAHTGVPANALFHAIWCLRDLPPAQRAAWRNIFLHYVFDADEETAAHIPEARRGLLAPIDEVTARRLRAGLLNRLNR